MSDFLRHQLRRFRAFLHSKDALVYLAFVLLATIIWFTNAFSTRREITISVPVNYVHIPDDYIFTTPPTDHIRVSIEDEGLDLFHDRNRLYRLTFDLSEYMHEDESTFVIPMDELRQAIVQQLAGDAALVAFAPELISGSYTRQQEKTVPVVYTGNIKPSLQHQLCGDAVLTPRVVRVFGTEQDLATIDHVETALTDYEGVQDTFVTRLPLIIPKGTRVLPDTVGLQVVAERFTEKAMQLTICTPDLGTDGQRMHLFPDHVTVTFHVGTTWFASINESDIEAYVELPQDGNDHLAVKVESHNPHITHIRIKPEEVEYLIENYDTHPDGGFAASVPED